jgi:hypothetical protein
MIVIHRFLSASVYVHENNILLQVCTYNNLQLSHPHRMYNYAPIYWQPAKHLKTTNCMGRRRQLFG